MIIHNHPSGDPTPSPDDHELTRRLAAAGVVMGIDLVDHIVLGDSRYCSFKEMGNRSPRSRCSAWRMCWEQGGRGEDSVDTVRNRGPPFFVPTMILADRDPS